MSEEKPVLHSRSRKAVKSQSDCESLHLGTGLVFVIIPVFQCAETGQPALEKNLYEALCKTMSWTHL
jgi:hypothetical protein